MKQLYSFTIRYIPCCSATSLKDPSPLAVKNYALPRWSPSPHVHSLSYPSMDIAFKLPSMLQTLKVADEHPSGKTELYLISTEASTLFQPKVPHLPQNLYHSACSVVHEKCGKRMKINKCIWLMGVIWELWFCT